jgi:D-tyrosyl-tRNA(Tyr) deacylase
MRAVIQRVTQASVTIQGQPHAQIGHGLVVLLGIDAADQPEDAEWLCGKIVRLRIFADAQGQMNRALAEVGGELLVVSQFTLFASTMKGNRPSFLRAALPDLAVPLYQRALTLLQAALGRPVAAGVFGAEMQVMLINDGPVTIIIDSRARE